MAIRQFPSAFPGGYKSGFERNLSAAEGMLRKMKDVNNQLYTAKLQKALIEKAGQENSPEQEALMSKAYAESEAGHGAAATLLMEEYEENRKAEALEALSEIKEGKADGKKKGILGTIGKAIAAPFIPGVGRGSAPDMELKFLSEHGQNIDRKLAILKKVTELLPTAEKETYKSTTQVTKRDLWKRRREDVENTTRRMTVLLQDHFKGSEKKLKDWEKKKPLKFKEYMELKEKRKQYQLDAETLYKELRGEIAPKKTGKVGKFVYETVD